MIKLTVNNQDYEVNTFAVSPVWSRNRTESESDYASLIIKTKEEIDWRIYSPAEINNEQYVVQGYKMIQKGTDHYEYEVTLTENIDYFTQTYPESRTFTTWVLNGVLKTNTIKSILEIYKETLFYYKDIAIDFDENDDEYLTNVQADVFDGENFKEILVNLFDRIDALPRVYRNGSTWFITYEKFNAKNEPINLDEGYTAKQDERNNSEYGTSMYVKAKNAIYSHPVHYPNENGYIRARSENRIYKQSEAKITTPSKIAELNKVLAVGVMVRIWNETTEEFDIAPEDIDITRQVITKEEFDVTDEVGNTDQYEGKTQANVLYYTPIENTIEHMYVPDGGILSFWSEDVNVTYNAINTAWRQRMDELGIEYGENDGPLGVSNDPSDWRWRIQYTPMRDQDVDIDRQDASNMTSSQMISQQNSGQIDFGRFAKNQMGAINRIGNQMRQNTYEIKAGERLPELGDYDGNWVVVYVRHVLRNNSTQSTVLATKNFNNLRAHYAINRELSPFTISQTPIVTNLISKTFVEVSKEEKENTDIYLTDFGKQAMLSFANGGFDVEAKIENGSVFRNRQTAKQLYIETIVNATDGHISTHSQYTSRTLAGYQLDEDQSFWSNKKTLIPLKYTTSEGRVNRFDLNIGHNLTIEDDYSLPKIDGDIDTIMNSIIKIDDAPIYLDSNGIFAHTHHISIITDNPDEIVNVRNFAVFNQLVTGEKPNLNVYVSDVPYNIFNTKVRESDVSSVVGIEWDNYRFRLTSPINESHWAMVDDNDNILMAFNNYEDNEYIYINFRRNRLTGEQKFSIFGGTHTQTYNTSGTIILSKVFYDIEGGTHTQTYQTSGTIILSKVFYDIEGGTHTQEYNTSGQIQATNLSYNIDSGTHTQTYNTSGDINLTFVTANVEGTHIQSYNVSGSIAQTYIYLQASGTHTQTYNTTGIIGYEVATSAPTIISATLIINNIIVEVRNEDSDSADILLGFDENTNDDVISNLASGSSTSVFIPYSGETPTTVYARAISSSKLVSLLVSKNID